MSRLKEQYQNEIVDAMIKKFGYKNIMEVPKLDKIVVNMGVGEAKENAKLLEAAIKDMEAITGQKAVATKAKNSIANFKIREGMAIGCKTTLRGEKMYGHHLRNHCQDRRGSSRIIDTVQYAIRQISRREF